MPFFLFSHHNTLLTLAIVSIFIGVSPLLAESSNPWTAQSALDTLKTGNARFVANASTHPNEDKATRDNLAQHGQTPLAAILSCSDSRAPVEEIFDLGFGDIFSVRAAGEVPGVDELGSLEYAVGHLGVPLVVVLGHTKCGAVTAAVEGAEEDGNLGELLKKISPVASLVADLPEDQRVEAAVTKTAQIFKNEVTRLSPEIAELVKEGKVTIVSAVYDIDTGQVNFLED